MSLLTQASIVITPNGYKEGKLYSVIPSDGSGDMSVVRATTATRVNSAGLVELVPYNLLTYSEQFDNAAWDKSSGTIIANSTTAPNGTTTADTFTGNGVLGAHDFFQGFTVGANTTASIYVKKNTAQFVYISLNYQSSGVNWATGIYDLDNLTTATFQSGGVTNQVATITDEGNGWRRITLSVATANTDLFCMYGLSDSMSPTLGPRGRVENSSLQSFYAWGAQLVQGSTAKDYQKTETRLNIPRLDYSNGTCPSLLVEPQRTNLLTYSSSFNSAGWLNVNASVTSDTTISPSGISDADTISFSSGGYVGQSFSSSGFHSFSVYAKYIGTQWLYIQNYNGGDFGTWFDIQNGVIGTIESGVTASIEQAENGFYRCTITMNASSGSSSIWVFFNTPSNGSYSRTGSSYFWGAQLEAGNYSTSYIPTTSASVTRNADVISKTGISSLIGQTEGTILLDFVLKNPLSATNRIFSITESNWASGGSLRVDIESTLIAVSIVDAGSATAGITYNTTITQGTRYKVAIAYKQNDCKMYVNGVDAGSTTSTGAMPTCSELYLNALGGGFNAPYEASNYNATALWKTRLTNTQLEALTGPGFNTYAQMAEYYNYVLQ